MTNLEGVRLTVSQPPNFTNAANSDTGLATVPSDLNVGEIYYTEDKTVVGNSTVIIPRLFTKNSAGTLVCLTSHVFSGTAAPTKGYRDGDIWIKTVE